jgi:hypothetical protein
MLMAAVDCPKQATLMVVGVVAKILGWVIWKLSIFVALPLVMVTLYVPAERAVMSLVFAVKLGPVQLYAKVPVPPATLSVMLPLVPPLQLTLVVVLVSVIGGVVLLPMVSVPDTKEVMYGVPLSSVTEMRTGIPSKRKGEVVVGAAIAFRQMPKMVVLSGRVKPKPLEVTHRNRTVPEGLLLKVVGVAASPLTAGFI